MTSASNLEWNKKIYVKRPTPRIRHTSRRLRSPETRGVEKTTREGQSTHLRTPPNIPHHRRYSDDIDEGDPSGARGPAEVFPSIGRHVWKAMSVGALSLSLRRFFLQALLRQCKRCTKSAIAKEGIIELGGSKEGGVLLYLTSAGSMARAVERAVS